MDYFESLAQRNSDFAEKGFSAELKMLPSKRSIIIGCVDPRVDPMDIFKLEYGEAVVIRNVGGRVNRELIATIEILGTVAKAAGKEVGDGWSMVLLHHTDCGINGCYKHAPDLLAKYLEVSTEDLETLAITNPFKAVEIDIEMLRAAPQVPSGVTVAAMVYDVKTGKVETITAPARLRP